MMKTDARLAVWTSAALALGLGGRGQAADIGTLFTCPQQDAGSGLSGASNHCRFPIQLVAGSAADFEARVRSVAQAEGIAVPLAQPFPVDTTSTPPEYRKWLGAWGPGAWRDAGDLTGQKMMIIIQGVDGSGNARFIYGVGSCCSGHPAFMARILFARQRFQDQQ